ncbi:CheY-like superfamily [Ochromonadaceae sp. CCMP2298]|nr:CheY-like superfamily [Ochromonadaceae sp. CCMP2298]
MMDLILMDFEMPRMNGPTATKTLRDMGCDLPIVGLTGNVLAEDLQFFMEHGLNFVLTKPLTAELLLETIDKCNEVRRGAGAGAWAVAVTGAGAGPRQKSGLGKSVFGSGKNTPRSARLQELPPLQLQVRPVRPVFLPARSDGYAVAAGDENV